MPGGMQPMPGGIPAPAAQPPALPGMPPVHGAAAVPPQPQSHPQCLLPGRWQALRHSA